MAGNQQAYQKAMNQGHSAAWDQDWKEAAKFYRAALEEFPDNPQGLSSLGLAYFELQDYENSQECYLQATNLAPADPVPQEKLARIFERMGKLKEAMEASLRAAELHLKGRDVDKAIDNWQHVLSLNPDHLSTRQRLAAVYEKTGKRAEAVIEYIATASIFQRNGDLTRALKAVEYASQMMPESQDARFALSTLRSNQMLPKPARPKGGTGPVRMASVKSLGQEDEDGEKKADPVEEARQKAMVLLAGLLFDQGDEVSDSPTARRGLGALTRGDTGTLRSGHDRTRIVLHVGQAIDSLTQNDESQASKELERALDLGLRNPTAYFILGLLQQGRDNDRSLRYLQEAQRHPDYDLACNLLIGQMSQQAGALNEAATAYMQALCLADARVVDPDRAEELRQAYEPLIDAQSSETDTEILKNICTTVANQINRPGWQQYLLMARQQMGAVPEGAPLQPVAEMILESRGSQVVEAMAAVRTLASKGMTRTAMEEAFFALQFAPTYLPLHVQIGEMLLQEQHVDEAVRKFMLVADLQSVRGETGRAVRSLKRILTVAPMDLRVRERLITLLVSQGKVDAALAEYMDLAEMYYRLAELDKARQTYLTALTLAQKSQDNRTWGVDILMKVADIDMQRLNLRQAVRIYEQVRTIQPDNVAVRSQIVLLNLRLGQEAVALGEVDAFLQLAESSGRRELGIEFLNDLLVEHGTNLTLRKRLADLYARSGQVQEAVTQLDVVAGAYLDQGQTLEAINMMETIIALQPTNVEEYKNALQALRKDSLRK
ncbi:MAG: tetratricopeptide repeat protein [Anaerolineaceae bacterium]|nr:tetratricopeptide repeat protein [Anaerolineaceae bacterium]